MAHNHLPEPNIETCPDMSGLSAPVETGADWTLKDIPDLTGKSALITGGAKGLGLATARALVQHGANILIVDVNAEAGESAATELRALAPGATVLFSCLDLADLSAIRSFSEWLLGAHPDINLLINNAGIYPPARRTETRDGFELTLAISVLGHFALTADLLPVMARNPQARVVTVSSITQAWGRLALDDFQSELSYVPNKVYARTKLASLMFGLELHARARAAGASFQSMVAHPGIARTTIGSERKAFKRGFRDRLEDGAQALAMRFFGQPVEQGALPILYAATSGSVEGGGFYGPNGFGQFSGAPVPVEPCRAARDESLRAQLWSRCEELTGSHYDFGAA